jgi:hypothetical protein
MATQPFQYLSQSTDLFNIIFREILKISPSLISKYPTLQDQIIYLILIPTVILFLFIVAFSKGIVGRIVGENKAFEYLLSVVTYIYLVYSGIFGATLVPIFTAWLNIAIVVALIVFVFSVIIHPARGPAIMRLAGEAGKAVGGKLLEKEKKAKELEKKIRSLQNQINSLESRYSATIRPVLIEREIAELERRKAELESELSEL